MRTTLSTWSVISLRNWHDAAWTTKTKTVQAVTTASWALSNLLAESPEAIEHVCSIGGMSTAVALLKSSVSCHEHACQYLCRLICGLGGGPSLAARRGRLELQRLGALEGLRMAQQHHAASTGDVLPAIFRTMQVLEAQVITVMRPYHLRSRGMLAHSHGIKQPSASSICSGGLAGMALALGGHTPSTIPQPKAVRLAPSLRSTSKGTPAGFFLLPTGALVAPHMGRGLLRRRRITARAGVKACDVAVPTKTRPPQRETPAVQPESPLQKASANHSDSTSNARSPVPSSRRKGKRFIDCVDIVNKHMNNKMPDEFCRGVTTGWASLDRLYRPVRGEVTVVTGTPGSGKSEFLFSLALNLAMTHGWRFHCVPFEHKHKDWTFQLLEKLHEVLATVVYFAFLLADMTNVSHFDRIVALLASRAPSGTIIAAPLFFSESGSLSGTLVFDHGDFAWKESCVVAAAALTISGDVAFRNCYSRSTGGAVRSAKPRLAGRGHGQITQVSGRLHFENCSAKLNGGAIAAWNVELRGQEVNFSNCRSDMARGGAIYAQVNVHVTAQYAIFQSCEATSGAAIWSAASVELDGWSTIIERCDCSRSLSLGQRSTAVVRAGFRQSVLLMNTKISRSVCDFGIGAIGSVSLLIQRCMFSWLHVGAIIADFAVDVSIEHASSEHVVRFLTARSVQRVRLQHVHVLCTPLTGTRCIDLDFWTDRAEIQFGDIQLHHRITTNLGGDSVLLRFPVNAMWLPGSDTPLGLTCYPGSYPEFSLTDDDHWEAGIFRATCSPCEYGTVSPSFVYFPLVFSNIAMDARPYEKWIKNFCIDCTTLAESVGALIACGRGKIEVPRGVMVTLHSLDYGRQEMLAWRCPNPSACPGQNHLMGGHGLEDQCSPGYAEGIAGCVTCESGYGRKINDPFVCQQCPPKAFQWILLSLQHVGLFGIGMMSAQRARRRTSVIFKIMVSFGTASCMSIFESRGGGSVKACNCILQAVSSLQEYHTAKVSLRSYVGLTETVTSATSLYNQSYECLFNTRNFSFYDLAIFETSPPLLLLLFCWILTWVASRCGFCHREVLMIQGTLVLGNTYMANVCAGFMKPLSCFQMNRPFHGGKALQHNSFLVWEQCRPLHGQAIAGVGVFVCILIVPMYWLEMIRRSHDWHSASRRKIMGFLVSHYRPGVEWWELVPLLRKVLLLQVRVFSPPSYAASTYLTLTLAVLVSSLLLHVVVWPYEDVYLNRIEGSALAASVTALLLASLAVAQEWDKNEALTLRYLMSLCIVLVIGTMILIVLLIRSLVEQVQKSRRRRDLALAVEMENCNSANGFSDLSSLTEMQRSNLRSFANILACGTSLVRIDELGCFDLKPDLDFLEEHFSRAGTFSEDQRSLRKGHGGYVQSSVDTELKSKGGLHGLMIDPYNCIEMPSGYQSETQVVSTMMSKLQQFAKRHSSHVWIVVHPTKGSQLAGNEPSMYDCSGSAHWFNKCDNGIIVRRPFAKSWAQQQEREKTGSSRQDAVIWQVLLWSRTVTARGDGNHGLTIVFDCIVHVALTCAAAGGADDVHDCANKDVPCDGDDIVSLDGDGDEAGDGDRWLLCSSFGKIRAEAAPDDYISKLASPKLFHRGIEHLCPWRGPELWRRRKMKPRLGFGVVLTARVSEPGLVVLALAEPEKAPEKVEDKKKKDRKPHLMAAVEEAFKKWDITGDGAISRYELHAALTQLGMDEAQVAKCFNSADISKDGMLQYDEFLDWVFKDPTVVCAYSLKTAKEGLHVCTPEACQEIWKVTEPFDDMDKVFFATMVILGEDRDLSWNGVRGLMKKPGVFLEKLHSYDTSHVTETTLRKLKFFTSKDALRGGDYDYFTQERFKSHHSMVYALCCWALAIASTELKSTKRH
eukprot:s516_g12.t1